MKLAFADESGDGGFVTNGSPPIAVVAGIVIDARNEAALEQDLLDWKRNWSPILCKRTDAEVQAWERKGSKLRSVVRAGPRGGRHKRDAYRRAVGMLDAVVAMLARREAHVFGGAVVKTQGHGGHARRRLMPDLCYESALRLHVDLGHGGSTLRLWFDHSTVGGTMQAAASRLATITDSTPGRGLVGTPAWVNSQDSPGVQLADIVTSALVAPIVSWRRLGARGEDGDRAGQKVLADRYHERLAELSVGHSGSPLIMVSDLRTGQQLPWSEI